MLPNKPIATALCVALGICLSGGAAGGDLPVDPAHSFAWAENVGWTNWRGATSSDQVILRSAGFLQGFLWGENAGWIFLGDGVPGNGMSYGNVDGADFGVNVDLLTGELSGFAWGENIGWVNFSTTAALGADGASFDESASRLRGYVWGENVGWLNLDDPVHFVGFECPADFNGDGNVGGADLATLLGTWGAMLTPGTPPDLDGDGVITAADLSVLLGSWGACF